MTTNVGFAKGVCSRCGKVWYVPRPAFPIICDCYKICPLCGAEMQPYTPTELRPQVYGKDLRRELHVFYVCYNHDPPYYSREKPVEVCLV